MAAFTLDVIAIVILLLQMVLAAVIVAGLIGFTGLVDQWQLQHWLIASPVLYFGWLLVFLLVSAVSFRLLGARLPKPRHSVIRRGQPGSRADLGILTAISCYRRFAVIESLPLVRAIEHTTWLNPLFFWPTHHPCT